MSEEIPDECMGCRSEGVDLESYPSYGHSDRVVKWLCKLCAGTFTGAWLDSTSENGSTEHEVLKTMCFIGNEIIKEIRIANRISDVQGPT